MCNGRSTDDDTRRRRPLLATLVIGALAVPPSDRIVGNLAVKMVSTRERVRGRGREACGKESQRRDGEQFE